jgi:molybdopterin-guanine dinucleotide biosynthesis protein A
VKRLGAIIAGGKATRFGSDKAVAMLNDQPLIGHVADGLRNQVDELIVCGRNWPGIGSIDDRPSADLGPLGGLNAALHYAQQYGFGEVVTAGCDVLPVPEFPRELPNGTAIYVNRHYLFGVWPAALAKILDLHLSEQEDYSMRHWITMIGARAINSKSSFHNLNTPEDVAKYAAETGMLV